MKKRPATNPDLELCLEHVFNTAREDWPLYIVIADEPHSKNTLKPVREVALAIFLNDRETARRLSLDPDLLRPALYERRGKKWNAVTVWGREEADS